MITSGPPPISARAIHRAAGEFQLILNEQQVEQIQQYTRVLLAWNDKVNLTAIRDPLEILYRHFCESMFGASILPVENCRLADVGSGAGFPGIALKIAFPSVQLLLIESNKKKCAFLSEVVRYIGLTDVEVLPERFEDIQTDRIGANIITARAVGGFKELIRWSNRSLAVGGHLVLWVGAEDSTRIARSSGWIWQVTQRVPCSKSRFILIGRPAQEDPALS